MQIDRQTDMQTYRQTECRHADIQTDTPTNRHTDMQTCRHTGMQTYRQTDIQTCRHTDMQTGRHIDRQTYTDIPTDRHTDVQAGTDDGRRNRLPLHLVEVGSEHVVLHWLWRNLAGTP